ncbi:Hypothetical predicted protein [Octopus vulgaris]|uniref:Uncharacterized protein n=1 Tax=Octopus vulgaris TaxID=6645 RepID=A0AA36B3S1_OCTVU|nr:Hypothetical predicted protein [Octopus vulgaris]
MTRAVNDVDRAEEDPTEPASVGKMLLRPYVLRAIKKPQREERDSDNKLISMIQEIQFVALNEIQYKALQLRNKNEYWCQVMARYIGLYLVENDVWANLNGQVNEVTLDYESIGLDLAVGV